MLIVQRRRLLLYPSYVQDYLDRVTAADVAAGNTQGLELGVTDAFNTTLQNLVGDNVLGVSGGVIAQPASTIKAMPFMVGARTLQGCLVPVVGAAPTNFNFVAGDYNRKTGLVGNGSTKYLNSNRNNNADPQNSFHQCVFVGAGPLDNNTRAYIGADGGRDHLLSGSTNLLARSRDSSVLGTVSGQGNTTGFKGANRSVSTEFLIRGGGANVTFSSLSSTPVSGNTHVFARSNTSHTNARLAFYSIGESLNLALLDARVTALINAIAAAIP